MQIGCEQGSCVPGEQFVFGAGTSLYLGGKTIHVKLALWWRWLHGNQGALQQTWVVYIHANSKIQGFSGTQEITSMLFSLNISITMGLFPWLLKSQGGVLRNGGLILYTAINYAFPRCQKCPPFSSFLSAVVEMLCSTSSLFFGEDECFNPLRWPIYAWIYMVSIGLGNSLLPLWHQAITWAKDGLSSIGHFRTKFSEIWITIQRFPFKKMHFKMLSAKWAF